MVCSSIYTTLPAEDYIYPLPIGNTEEKYESIPQDTKARNSPNPTGYYSNTQNTKRDGRRIERGGDNMNWMYECVEDPTDAWDEHTEEEQELMRLGMEENE